MNRIWVGRFSRPTRSGPEEACRAMLPRRWMEAYINFLLRKRWAVLGLAVVLTAFFVYQLTHTKIQMNFLDFYPPGHPYMQLVKKHARMSGSANVLVMAVEVKQGDIFNVETLNKINRLTIALLETPGVNGWQVLSISHPKMRNIEISSAGIQALPLFFPGPPKTQVQADRIKKAVYTNDGILGVHVSYDTQMALITAAFWESGLDFGRMKEHLFRLQAEETDAQHVIHMTGFPALFCWIFEYQPWIIGITLLTVLSIMALLWFYFRTIHGVWIPLFSGALSTVWALGFAGALGFSIDLLMIVVFLLITARALSHSVQSMERYHEEYARLGDKDAAILQSYLGLFSPALVSVASTEECANFGDIDQAIEQALMTTGRAILFTGDDAHGQRHLLAVLSDEVSGRDGVSAGPGPVSAHYRRPGVYSLNGVSAQAALYHGPGIGGGSRRRGQPGGRVLNRSLIMIQPRHIFCLMCLWLWPACQPSRQCSDSAGHGRQMAHHHHHLVAFPTPTEI